MMELEYHDMATITITNSDKNQSGVWKSHEYPIVFSHLLITTTCVLTVHWRELAENTLKWKKCNIVRP